MNVGELYADSPVWVKDKKATLNLIKRNDNKCFQYAGKHTLNY